MGDGFGTMLLKLQAVSEIEVNVKVAQHITISQVVGVFRHIFGAHFKGEFDEPDVIDASVKHTAVLYSTLHHTIADLILSARREQRKENY
jgi:hypothetical protein